MKGLIAIGGLALTVLAAPAMAYVVQVTTSIDVTDIAEKGQLRQAVESAVDDVLTNAIIFSPTVVTVENARVVGDQMYLRLLIADEDGEKMLETISGERLAPNDSDDTVESQN